MRPAGRRAGGDGPDGCERASPGRETTEEGRQGADADRRRHRVDGHAVSVLSAWPKRDTRWSSAALRHASTTR